jgi:Mitochondrial carrier protein
MRVIHIQGVSVSKAAWSAERLLTNKCVQVFVQTLRDKGIGGLFTGVGPRVTQVAVMSAVFFTLFEFWWVSWLIAFDYWMKTKRLWFISTCWLWMFVTYDWWSCGERLIWRCLLNNRGLLTHSLTLWGSSGFFAFSSLVCVWLYIPIYVCLSLCRYYHIRGLNSHVQSSLTALVIALTGNPSWNSIELIPTGF